MCWITAQVGVWLVLRVYFEKVPWHQMTPAFRYLICVPPVRVFGCIQGSSLWCIDCMDYRVYCIRWPIILQCIILTNLNQRWSLLIHYPLYAFWVNIWSVAKMVPAFSISWSPRIQVLLLSELSQLVWLSPVKGSLRNFIKFPFYSVCGTSRDKSHRMRCRRWDH